MVFPWIVAHVLNTSTACYLNCARQTGRLTSVPLTDERAECPVFLWHCLGWALVCAMGVFTYVCR